MTETDRSGAKPEEPQTERRPEENGAAAEHAEPLPDGEAIAEVGDVVGGPA
jgi:hypothetical protein